MRIRLYSWGSEGDIRPFFALARGLGRAGHDAEVSYVAVDGRDYGALAASIGIRARQVAASEIASAHANHHAASEALAGRGNPLTQIRTVLEELLDPAVEAMWADAESTLDACDVAVVHLLHHPAASLALSRRIPLIALQPVPVWPTRHLPPMGAPDLGPLNRLSWWLTAVVGGSWFLPRVNSSRRRAGVPLETRMFPRPATAALTLTCASPSLVPRPPDWEPSQQVSGFLDIPVECQGYTMDDSLRDFLAAGAAPLLMSFGSMLAQPTDDTRECVRVMVECAERLGRRALVQVPWEQLPDVPTSPLVHRLGRAPHAAILPHCSAFVHHGGAGTTHTACLAGIPSVIVPFLGDQFFWAARLRSLGVAPAPVPRRSLTAPRLAQGIEALSAMRDASTRARILARAMRAEDGVARAVHLVERVARSGGA